MSVNPVSLNPPSQGYANSLGMSELSALNLDAYFDAAFSAPSGVARLRELILTLAMQGKLAAQDSVDEPASKLLKKIAEEKAALVKASKIRVPKPLLPIAESEKPYALPSGWAWVRFGDIVNEIATGPFGSMIHKSDYVSNGVPLINPSHMIDGRIVPDPEVSVSANFSSELLTYRLNEGDIVIARRGEMGRCAVVAPENDGFLCGTGSFVIRFKREIDRRFIVCLFAEQHIRNYLGGNSVGTTMVNLNQGILEKMPILLPPLAEQRRIVARIDQLMARCDELEKLRAEQQEKRSITHTAALRQWLSADDAHAQAHAQRFIVGHFDELHASRGSVAGLRKAILQLAVMGRLVPHDASSEFVELKELATKIGSGSTPSGGKSAYKQSGIPLIRSMNVHFGGFKYDGLAFIDDAQARKLDNVTVKANDVLLNITGASIGRVTIAPREMEGARVNQHVCIIRTNERIQPRYLELCLAAPYTQDRIFDVQVGATREALTKGMIEKFPIPLPPRAEQKRIVAKLDELMALCDALESRIDAAESKQSQLLEAVMAAA